VLFYRCILDFRKRSPVLGLDGILIGIKQSLVRTYMTYLYWRKKIQSHLGEMSRASRIRGWKISHKRKNSNRGVECQPRGLIRFKIREGKRGRVAVQVHEGWCRDILDIAEKKKRQKIYRKS